MFEILTSREMASGNGERVGVSIGCLTVRLGDVCATLKKTRTWNISKKVIDTMLFYAAES